VWCPVTWTPIHIHCMDVYTYSAYVWRPWMYKDRSWFSRRSELVVRGEAWRVSDSKFWSRWCNFHFSRSSYEIQYNIANKTGVWGSFVEGEVAYIFIVADQSQHSILRSQVKLVSGQMSLNSFGQWHVIIVQQYANEGDFALQNSAPLKCSPKHMYIYLTVFVSNSD
jgi:hypothetical protein